jgi:WD40 repeat protein
MEGGGWLDVLRAGLKSSQGKRGKACISMLSPLDKGVESGKLSRKFGNGCWKSREEQAMNSIRWLMILGALLGFVSVAEAKVPRCFEYLEGHTKPVLCVAISPDSKLVASGSSDGTVRFWEVATGKQIHAFKANPQHVRNVSFSPDGKTIIACSCESLEFPAKFGRLDSRITWWDVKTHKQIRQLKFDEARLPMALSPDGKTIAVASRYWIYFYQADTGKALGRVDTIDETYALAFSPDSRRLAVAVLGEGVEIRDLTTKKVVQHVRSDYTYSSIAFSRDGKRLAGSNGVTVTEIHDLEGKKRVVTSKDFCDGQQGLAFVRGGKWLVIARGSLFILSARSGNRVGMASEAQRSTSSVAVSRDGKILAVAGMANNDISLWKPDEWEWKTSE